LLRRHYPASTLLRPCPTPAVAVACRDVEAATLAHDGSPPITRTIFPTCRAHYPGGSSGCACRLLPRSCSLPQMAGGSASALSLSRPAEASLTLRPAGLLSRQKRPLSRGSSPSGYPAEPLVSYRINRQLSGWILPPLMIRAFGAHGQEPTFQVRCDGSKWLCPYRPRGPLRGLRERWMILPDIEIPNCAMAWRRATAGGPMAPTTVRSILRARSRAAERHITPLALCGAMHLTADTGGVTG
jgi:hypothetical protein